MDEPQTLEEYNQDLEKGIAEIEAGDFITAEDLKIESKNW
jgi:predicted transcriptional regulator